MNHHHEQACSDDLSPLEKLKTFPSDWLTIMDFCDLKGGRDKFSKLTKDEIVQLVSAGEWAIIAAAFNQEKYQLKAARWRLRGLSVDTAIRKVQIDREIGHKIAERKNARPWDEDE